MCLEEILGNQILVSDPRMITHDLISLKEHSRSLRRCLCRQVDTHKRAKMELWVSKACKDTRAH